MLTPEILSLNPDIVTYYGGLNDIGNFVGPGTRELDYRSPLLFVDVFRSIFFNYQEMLRARTSLFDLPQVFLTRDQFEPEFKSNLLFLADRFKKQGVRFIVVTQKIVEEDVDTRRKSYADYFAALSASRNQRNFSASVANNIAYAHYQLMRGMASYSKNNFILLDGISALDGHADCFVTHVHLASACNAILADLIKPEILRLTAHSGSPRNNQAGL